MLVKVSKKMKLPHVRLQQTQLGAYHSTKNFEIFETGTNGTETSWEKFQKIRNCWISEKRTIQPKIPEISG